LDSIDRHVDFTLSLASFQVSLVSIEFGSALRMNLFTHRDLWSWLNQPFDIPPVPYEPEQLSFNLA